MSQELFDEAIRLEEEGQLERALGVWRQLAETNPSRNVFLRIANITEDLGLLDDAEQALNQALKIDGRSALALMGLGSLAIDRRDYETAANYLKRAREIKEDPAVLSMLGVALRNSGKILDAEEAYRRAIHIDPKFEEAYYNLGVLLKRDRPSEAQRLFRTALELDPAYACAYRELGHVLIKPGTNPEGESHLRKAIQLDPADVWAHIYLGSYLWRCADIDAAIAEFESPSSFSLTGQFRFGPLAISTNSNTRTSIWPNPISSALKIDPDDAITLRNLGRLFKKRGQVDLAREYLNRALLQDPFEEKASELLTDLNGDARE